MSDPPTQDASVDPWAQLPACEVFWRDRYDWLKSIGFTLRPRYKPDWIPSWTNTDILHIRFEDSVEILVRIFPFFHIVAQVHSP